MIYKLRSNIRHIVLGVALLLAGCTTDDNMVNDQSSMANEQCPVGQPVLFSAGNLAEARTRTGEPLGSGSPYYHGMTNTSSVPYMAQDGRFVCTMYYHAKATDTDASDFDIADGGTMTTAWLKVNNNVGNSVFRKGTFDETGMNEDRYHFDRASTIFYWQNRLTHAFLALADYNKLTTNVGTTTNTTEDKGKLKMYPESDTIDVDNNFYANAYDLTRGEIWEEQDVEDGNGGTVKKKVLTGYEVNTIYQQPDPILALTIMKPAGASPEANRVRLYFKHQFSQIQVNLKGADDNSAEITTDQIEGVELLGVSTEGYVCNRLNADGTVGAASAKDVNLDEFSDAVLENNKWGTSFQMFDMATGVDADQDDKDDGYAIGYLKSYNAIAFGQLWAIRITWHEGTTLEPGIRHISTFEVPIVNESNENIRELASGMKYIYNLELRRGTLAVIRTEILPWEQKSELVYGTDGTITN